MLGLVGGMMDELDLDGTKGTVVTGLDKAERLHEADCTGQGL